MESQLKRAVYLVDRTKLKEQSAMYEKLCTKNYVPCTDKLRKRAVCCFYKTVHKKPLTVYNKLLKKALVNVQSAVYCVWIDVYKELCATLKSCVCTAV